MKRFFTVIITTCISIFAMSEDDHLIRLQIPQNINIKDRVILCNESSCTILRAVVVDSSTSEQTIIGTCNIVSPGGSVSIANFDRNGLKFLKGHNITIKVKGVTKRILDYSGTSIGGGSFSTGPFAVGVGHAEMKADDINNIEDEYITYDFTASLSEKNHDLYIYIYDNVDGGGVLNF